MDELKLVNAVELLLAGELGHDGYSGLAVWEGYALGPLVYGRNYDYVEMLKDFASDLVIAAFHPEDGSLSAAIIGCAGEIYAVNGMNEKGIFLELNNGLPSGGPMWNNDRVPAVASLFSFLFDGESLSDMESFFMTVNSNFAYIIGVTDGICARSYEWPVFGVKRREDHKKRDFLS